jgi:hypothetical protein
MKNVQCKMTSYAYETTLFRMQQLARLISKRILHCAFFIFYFTSSHAQPVGTFLDDTIEVGRPFRYALTVRHPASDDVLFPDTARQFAPFLVRDVAVFPTRTQANSSTDSAVYTLVSFEVSRARTLRVPVYIVRGTDCTAVLAAPDTVFLRSAVLASARPDTLRLLPDTHVATLPQQFNYANLMLTATAMGVVVMALYILFGQAARQRWALYVLGRKHQRFLDRYGQLIGLLSSAQVSPEAASEAANQAVVTWKQYLEKTERQPYTSLTTREIGDRIGDDRVADALRETDRMIYGGTFTDESPKALQILRDVAVAAYTRKVKE